MAPAVGFPILPLRQRHRIACATVPCGRSGKQISASPYNLERLYRNSREKVRNPSIPPPAFESRTYSIPPARIASRRS